MRLTCSLTLARGGPSTYRMMSFGTHDQVVDDGFDERNLPEYCEPLSEIIKGVIHRVRDVLPAPFDFTQTWVDGAPKHGRLMFGGHSEMDVPYYVMVPLHLLCF
ncbi:hypothetical protein C4D60_Mb01t33370 [Musa balbisiana]|uniref:Uncharacterized protein n=1 Tax=Musa balbisiana TaxID=52838 RepID=A0A4S8JSK2_MUSBA|nr:hypothetical protein C4D60_Mb01t33370 [Musa balbisiana]